MAIFQGGSGRDLYTGGNAADAIYGNGGNDKLGGGGGADLIAGESGADVLMGDAGDDVIYSDAIDAAFGGFLSAGVSYDKGSEVDHLTGGTGDDYIFAGAGDFVDGGASDSYGDRLYISFQGASAGVNADFRPLQSGQSVTIAGGTIKNIQNVGYLEGSEFDDTLATIDTFYPTGAAVYGRGGNDLLIADYYAGWSGGLWGGDGDDEIDATGAQYGPSAYGEAGDDVIRMRSGLGDMADGGDGDDTIFAGGETHGGAGNDRITMQFTYYTGLVTGDAGDDEIRAASQGNRISGGDGADVLIGDGGDDWLVSGNFAVSPGNSENDTGVERDTLSGGGGSDSLYAGYGDTVDGGAGNDILSLTLSGADQGVRLATGDITAATGFTYAGATITGIERLRDLTATGFADRITLSSTTNVTVHGMAGNDRFVTGLTSATLHGDDGNDTLVSGAAADWFNGGAGLDIVDYSASREALSFALGDGTSTGGGGDKLIGVEAVLATRFADELVGNSANNRFMGNGAGDSLSGAGGDDRLDGGSGRDLLTGGDGGDELHGGADRDALTGGGGRDTFLFEQASVAHSLSEADIVTDFSQADRDKLDLSMVDAVTETTQVDPFVFVGTAAFSDRAGELRYEFAGKRTLVSADTDGDGIGDVFIKLDGRVALEAKDFVFATSPAASAFDPEAMTGAFLSQHAVYHERLGTDIMLM